MQCGSIARGVASCSSFSLARPGTEMSQVMLMALEGQPGAATGAGEHPGSLDQLNVHGLGSHEPWASVRLSAAMSPSFPAIAS